MAYKVFPTNKIYNEIFKKTKILDEEIPIINDYYTQFRAKQKPIIQNQINIFENLTDNEIRNKISNELSGIIKNDDILYVVESLDKSGDLKAFYTYIKSFKDSIKNINNLNGSFLLLLWQKFKSNLIFEDTNKPKGSSLTASEYEKALKFNRKVPISEPIYGNPTEILSYPNTGLKEIIKMIHSGNKAKLNKEIRQVGKKPKKGEYTLIPGGFPRKSPAVGRPPILTEKLLNKRTGTYEKKPIIASSTPTISSELASSYKGGNIIGHTFYARR
jgi:hypothetical protein